MQVEVTEAKGIKRATGHVAQGIILIRVPKHWNRRAKQEAVDYLAELLRKQNAKEEALLHWLDHMDPSQFITLDNLKALNAHVRQINAETLNVPLQKVRIGQAKYSRLAQMNTQTRVMTISQYCLKGVPEAALRYLIIHELAHLIEANHSARFWRLVSLYVPDWKQQSRIIKAFHKRAVDLADLSQSAHAEPAAAKPSLKLVRPPAPKPSPPITTVFPVPEPRKWWQLKLF